MGIAQFMHSTSELQINLQKYLAKPKEGNILYTKRVAMMSIVSGDTIVTNVSTTPDLLPGLIARHQAAVLAVSEMRPCDPGYADLEQEVEDLHARIMGTRATSIEGRIARLGMLRKVLVVSDQGDYPIDMVNACIADSVFLTAS